MDELAACDVLLVEDDPNDALFLRAALGKVDPGCILRVLVDGEDAVAYLEPLAAAPLPGSLPTLIITDLKMPRKNGHELIEWVKLQRGLADVPIVMLSSSELHADVQRALTLGASACFLKPAKPTELRALLGSLLQRWPRARRSAPESCPG